MASEPFVTDPIAFDWSADGRLWVVEMGDYPMGLDGKGKPGGKVRFLEDSRRPTPAAADRAFGASRIGSQIIESLWVMSGSVGKPARRVSFTVELSTAFR